MLDYAALSALAAVVREGSFERAARALHVTPSAISQRIRALEERAGCALVVREQPCRATEAGRRLCQHVDQVRLLEHELHGALPALAPIEFNPAPLPIAVNADSLATWLAPAIASYAAAHPVLLEVAVDDEDHTSGWLRNGAVLAAVTATAQPCAGCNSEALGAMRYLACASPAFVQRYLAGGVTPEVLARAPSLRFNLKDDLQSRWVQQQCGQAPPLPHHLLPSSQAFVTAAVAGMGWGMQAEALAAPHLASGALVELLPNTPLDVPLYWQHARVASSLLDDLGAAIALAARNSLLPP